MRILICDDHKIVRLGLVHLISMLEGVTFVSEAKDGTEALNILKKESFDIVLMDISLPGMSGLEALEVIKSKWPSVRVLMLSMLPQEQYAVRALKMGASGYLTKDIAAEDLLAALTKVYSGGTYITDSLAEKLANQLNQDSHLLKHESLSRREFEILIHLANGKSIKEIGNTLFISNKTVSTHRKRIMEKMDMARNTELAKYCIEHKLM